MIDGNRTFDEMLDELDANIKRIKAELAREEAAFADELMID